MKIGGTWVKSIGGWEMNGLSMGHLPTKDCAFYIISKGI